jgi:hypothetical protein
MSHYIVEGTRLRTNNWLRAAALAAKRRRKVITEHPQDGQRRRWKLGPRGVWRDQHGSAVHDTLVTHARRERSGS